MHRAAINHAKGRIGRHHPPCAIALLHIYYLPHIVRHALTARRLMDIIRLRRQLPPGRHRPATHRHVEFTPAAPQRHPLLPLPAIAPPAAHGVDAVATQRGIYQGQRKSKNLLLTANLLHHQVSPLQVGIPIALRTESKTIQRRGEQSILAR